MNVHIFLDACERKGRKKQCKIWSRDILKEAKSGKGKSRIGD